MKIEPNPHVELNNAILERYRNATNNEEARKYSPHAIWYEFVTICHERDTKEVIITQPHHFKSNVHSVKRRNVIKELHKRGATIAELEQICPLSLRSLERMVYGS